MGDRVAVICGGAIAWDHLPLPIPELGGVGGPGTVYPFDAGTISIDDLCYAYYRVKTWQIDVDITRTVPPDPPYNSVGTFYANAGELTWTSGAPLSGPFTRESDLVVPRGTTATDPTTTSNFAIFCDQSEVSNDVSDARSARLVGSFSPQFLIECEVDGGPSSTVDPTHHGAGTLHFLGSDYALYSNDSGWSGNVTIAPIEFWSYATKAGLPVYNTSTGAQINSPFS